MLSDSRESLVSLVFRKRIDFFCGAQAPHQWQFTLFTHLFQRFLSLCAGNIGRLFVQFGHVRQTVPALRVHSRDRASTTSSRAALCAG